MSDIINLEYPYYKLFYKLNKNRIKKIVKNFNPNIITNKLPKFKNIGKYENKYFIIIDKWMDNYELNSLTDYFTEKERVKCNIGNFITPLKYWQINKKNLLKLQNIYNIREQIFKETKLCNNFRVSVAITILKTFNVKKWLDISAGWGDRLLSAILYKVKFYCGVDPNKDLHKHYLEMINTFVTPKNKKNFILIEDGFETAKLPNIKYDLVFSSPPFFDLEKYSKYENDSLVKYNNEKDWVDKFLMVSIYKAIGYLEKNGHLILYLHSSEYVNKRLLEINKILKFKGYIYFYDTKIRGMSVWQKN